MPASHDREPPVRRFEHAHRIEPSIRSGQSARRPAPRASQPRPRPAGASALAIVVVALLAVVLRPWDGVLGAASDDRGPGRAAPSAAVAGATQPGPQTPGLPATATSRPSETDGAEPGDVRATREPTGAAPEPILPGYEWPLRNARITNSFGPGRPGSFLLDGVKFHDGLDIASFCGAHITAAHGGIVLGAGRRTEGLLGWVGDLSAFRAKVEAEDGWGRQAITVVIDDGNGHRSVYAHLGVAAVDAGDTVVAGDLIGYEGASGNATGCHLHYAIFNPADPGRLTLEARTARKTKLPALEIARIDPLLVLPPPEDAGITWGWGSR